MNHSPDQLLYPSTNDPVGSFDQLWFSNILNSSISESFEDVSNISSPLLFEQLHNPNTPISFSPLTNVNTNSHDSSNIAYAAAVPKPSQYYSQRLEIVAQPCLSSKLRYRSDYDKNKSRLGVLKNTDQNNSSYRGPAIRIPERFLDPNRYFIRVVLLTVQYLPTQLNYFHPYELEHPTDEQMNDRNNNVVIIPILPSECSTGIKSFPFLRIVKKREQDLRKCKNLREFDCFANGINPNVLELCESPKKTISQYNLDRSLLAFTVAECVAIENNKKTFNILRETTVLSDEIASNPNAELEGDGDVQGQLSPLEQPNQICRVYKYAPRYGFDTFTEDMVIFLTKKLEPKTYGELKITFECTTNNGLWSKTVENVDIKDRVISFKTPICDLDFENNIAVDIKLRQTKRDIETIKYFYLATLGSCNRCNAIAIGNRMGDSIDFPRKRLQRPWNPNDLETDTFQPKAEKSDLTAECGTTESSSSNTDSKILSPTSAATVTKENGENVLIDTLGKCIESIFIHDDYTELFRLSRSFLKRNYQMLHDSLDNNQTDLLLKYIPTSLNKILKQKNQTGETLLLHALRLNNVEILQCLLKKEKFDLIDGETDNDENNLFHIIASYGTSIEIIHLLLDYFDKNSIDIQKQFGVTNRNNQTPLELAIRKNNILFVKSLLKYFKIDFYKTEDNGDNIIHLAVRHGDLTMIKSLIEDGKLDHLGNQSNFEKTPKELAQSLKRDDIFDYLNMKYPQPEITTDESSDEED